MSGSRPLYGDDSPRDRHLTLFEMVAWCHCETMPAVAPGVR